MYVYRTQQCTEEKKEEIKKEKEKTHMNTQVQAHHNIKSYTTASIILYVLALSTFHISTVSHQGLTNLCVFQSNT